MPHPLNHLKKDTLDDNSLSITSAAKDDSESLARQLFGFDLEAEESSSWNELITQKWQELSRKGLPAEQRDSLFKKYSPSESVAFLKASILNQQCKVALKNNSIVKKEEYAWKN